MKDFSPHGFPEFKDDFSLVDYESPIYGVVDEPQQNFQDVSIATQEILPESQIVREVEPTTTQIFISSPGSVEAENMQRVETDLDMPYWVSPENANGGNANYYGYATPTYGYNENIYNPVDQALSEVQPATESGNTIVIYTTKKDEITVPGQPESALPDTNIAQTTAAPTTTQPATNQPATTQDDQDLIFGFRKETVVIGGVVVGLGALLLLGSGK